MTKRSDFAQKLLDDFSVAEEADGCLSELKGFKSKVADAYAYSKATYKSSRKPEAVKATGFRAGSTQNRPSGGRKSVSTGQASNQIVPFGGGKKPQQMGDETGGYGKMERINRAVSRQQPSSSQLPTLSIHIEEISRGAQKLIRSSATALMASTLTDIDKNWKGTVERSNGFGGVSNVACKHAGNFGLLDNTTEKSRLTLLEKMMMRTPSQWLLLPIFRVTNSKHDKKLQLPQIYLLTSDQLAMVLMLNSHCILRTNSLNSIAVQTREVQNSKCDRKADGDQ
ncbi:hypothetical protein F3Y22_tig00003725pilonHSYRG00145 [Hibiscus syriacus]|uniref:Uncharacterized protein n=1 Tax=Hibiscus syriacus TaxID=106335 RepID=A0A6A3CII3_HIBSY|nr:hypothetical protein F3Y22_tig00003725pilonHSYRG00145 [Hibiscus syriacus]